MPQTDGLWHDVLKMTATKQELFMERVLLLHKIALKKRAGKSSNVRLTLSKWESETNIMAVLGHVLQEMDNRPNLFKPEHVKAASQKILEGSPSCVSKSIVRACNHGIRRVTDSGTTTTTSRPTLTVPIPTGAPPTHRCGTITCAPRTMQR